MIAISKEHVDKIIQQALDHSPVECCGMLAGTFSEEDVEVVDIYPMRNVDNSPEHFSLDPEEQFQVFYSIRDRGLKMLGNYHSHPATPARPSEEDIRLAHDPNAVYMIVSLAGQEPVLKCFFIRAGNYEEIPILVRD